MSSYVNTIFSKVFLTSNIIAENQAVTKKYVDDSFSATNAIELSPIKSDITHLQSNKLDTSNGYFKRADGDFQISQSSCLYIGDSWRIRPLTGSNPSTDKLIYEHKTTNNGIDTWTQGVPFVRPVNI